MYRSHYHSIELQLELVAPKHSLPRAIGRPLFRAGAYQRRDLVPSRHRKPARRACVETHPENDPGVGNATANRIYEASNALQCRRDARDAVTRRSAVAGG